MHKVTVSCRGKLTGFSAILTGGRGVVDIYLETVLSVNEARRAAVVALVDETADELERRLVVARKEQ